MYKTFLFVVLYLFVQSGADAQKIEYAFGEKSDVIDSIKSIIVKLKTWQRAVDVPKLSYFASIGYLEGDLYVHVNCFVKGDSAVWEPIAAKSNRIIRVDDSFYLPLIFDADILTEGLGKKYKFLPIGGYSIKIERVERDDSWHVSDVRMFF